MSQDTAGTAEAHPRPWTDHYPEGIEWDVKLNLTPVHEQVLASCAKRPETVALDFLGGTTTYGALGRDIRAFAGALQTQYGVKKGTRVALLLPNTPFFPVAYYGVLLAGGTVVNCNPLYTVSELSHIFSNSGAEIIVTLDLKLIFEKAEALVAAGHVKKVILCHFPDALPLVKKVLYTIAKRGDLTELAASKAAPATRWYADLLRRRDRPTPVPIDVENDVAVQQYTGGTTGLPRGAMLSHKNIAANMSQIDAWGCGLFYAPSKVLAVLPFFHIFAMTVCMNVPLCNGIQVIMLPRFEMKGFLDAIARTGVNILPAVPTLIQALTRVDAEGSKKLESLEVVVSGGAPLPNEVREKFARISKALLAEGYGLTEASPVVCCAALRVPSKPLSIGQPLPATDIRLVDVETGKVVPVGERGELQVRGPQVMIGYFNDPDATRNAFVDGWLHSGDVAHMDDDGYLFIVDRIKDLIINGGFNVYPRIIEEALMNHTAVDEVCVIGAADQRRGEVPIAYVKLKDGMSATQQDLQDFLDPHLNKLEIPREIIFKDQLPKTLVGKLSKKDLREEYKAKGRDVNRRESENRDLFAIADLAREFGISTRAIRFYESKGLLNPERVGSTRVFRRRDRARLILILRGKRLGFSLRDISDYLSLYDADRTQKAQVNLLVEMVDARMDQLTGQLADLQTTIAELREIRKLAGERLAQTR